MKPLPPGATIASIPYDCILTARAAQTSEFGKRVAQVLASMALAAPHPRILLYVARLCDNVLFPTCSWAGHAYRTCCTCRPPQLPVHDSSTRARVCEMVYIPSQHPAAVHRPSVVARGGCGSGRGHHPPRCHWRQKGVAAGRVPEFSCQTGGGSPG